MCIHATRILICRLFVFFLYLKHYQGTEWKGLSQDVMSAAITLGWDESTWGKPQLAPASYLKKWIELSEEKKIAARVICHFDVTWPGDGTSINLLTMDDLMNDASQKLSHVSFLQAVMAIVMVTLYAQT